MTTYYISPTGNDANSGVSKKTPFKTPNRTAGILKPGDSVLLKRGSEFFSSFVIDNSGTSSKPITIGPYGRGAKPVLKGGTQLLGSNVVIEKIVFGDCVRDGLWVGGSSNVITDVEAYGNIHGIVLGEGANFNKVLNCHLHHNNKMAANTPGTFDDYGAVGVVVQGDYNEIGYNTINDNLAPSADFGTDGSAVEIYGGVGTLVHNNTATNNRTFTELGHKRTSDTVYAFNKVTSSLKDSEFLITRGEEDTNFGPVRNTCAVGNAVVLTGANSTGFVVYAGTQTALLALYDNSISAVKNVGVAPDGTIVGGNNLYLGPVWFKMLPGDRKL